jgi:hypothetical protein
MSDNDNGPKVVNLPEHKNELAAAAIICGAISM